MRTSSGDSGGMTRPVHVVLDAGPLIHLDELQGLDLLEGLGELHLPAVVMQEALKHRPALRLEVAPPIRVNHESWRTSPRLGALAAALGLHAGEVGALQLARQLPARLFLTDDAAARLAGEALGLRVHGTIGLLVRAVRRHTRTVAQVRTTLETIPVQSSLHLSRELLHQVLAQLPS